MRLSNAFQHVRSVSVSEINKKRREFDASMDSLREMRRLRCAERKVPMPPVVEVAT